MNTLRGILYMCIIMKNISFYIMVQQGGYVMLEGLLTWLYDIVWSKPLVYGLLLTGVLFSFMMRFFQIRHFKEMIRLMFQGEKSPTGISSFQAIALSLAGRVGTGNIVGVSTAIFIVGVLVPYFGCGHQHF